jgi:2-polyprenyl-6-methoxyphenol hydroxylase-like FAD-dependent oxidoreductase/SAM-dependent methyltransferase
MLLAQSGVRCAVLERDYGATARFGGELLKPFAVRVLEQLGFIGPIMKRGAAKIRDFHCVFPCEDGTPESFLPFPECAALPTHALAVRHADLHDALREHVRSDGRISLLEGCEVTSLHRESGGKWQVHARDGHGSEFVLQTPLVVGADGAQSVVRSAQDFDTTECRVDNFAVGFVLECGSVAQIERFVYVLDRNETTFLYPLGRSLARLGVLVEKDFLRVHRDRLQDVVLERSRQVLERAGYALGDAKVVDEMQVTACLRIRSRQAARNGICLLGDALGTVNVLTGLGMTVAVSDALELASCLHDYFVDGQRRRALDAAQGHYQRAMSAYRSLVEQFSDRMVQGFFGESSAERRALIRRMGVAAVAASPDERNTVRENLQLGAAMSAFLSGRSADLLRSIDNGGESTHLARNSDAMSILPVASASLAPNADGGALRSTPASLNLQILAGAGLSIGASDEPQFPSWEIYYQQHVLEHTPWHYSGLDPDLQEVLTEQGITSGTFLDLGTGSGTQATALARRGFDVIATDVSPTAIHQAAEHASSEGATISFHIDDIVDTRMEQPVDFVLDRGCFHGLAPRQRRAYVRNLAGLVRPRGLLFLKCLSHGEERNLAPHRFSVGEVEELFKGFFELRSARKSVYQGTLNPAPQALFCVLERTSA